jgi:hypothetical protein
LIKTVFPTSSDIYIEVNGRKLAVVENYKARASRENHYIEAFGEKEPVGTTGGKTHYIIELGRVYAADTLVSDGISFYSLSDFNLVIVKPDRKVIYSGCEWSNITEGAEIGDVIIEKITLIASKRLEVR